MHCKKYAYNLYLILYIYWRYMFKKKSENFRDHCLKISHKWDAVICNVHCIPELLYSDTFTLGYIKQKKIHTPYNHFWLANLKESYGAKYMRDFPQDSECGAKGGNHRQWLHSHSRDQSCCQGWAPGWSKIIRYFVTPQGTNRRLQFLKTSHLLRLEDHLHLLNCICEAAGNCLLVSILSLHRKHKECVWAKKNWKYMLK